MKEDLSKNRISKFLLMDQLLMISDRENLVTVIYYQPSVSLLTLEVISSKEYSILVALSTKKTVSTQ
jgi:hypothetical protein